MNETFTYRGWLCEWHEQEGCYYLYSPDQQEKPVKWSTSSTESEIKKRIEEFIDRF